MNSELLLNVIGEKASYRLYEGGIKVYIRTSSRADINRLKIEGRNTFFILFAAVCTTALIFTPINPLIKWPTAMIAALIWTIWAHNLYMYFQQKYGVETISVRKGKISYRRYLNHPGRAILISHVVRKLPITLEETQSAIRSNSIIGQRRGITSYVKLHSYKNGNRLAFHPALDEAKKIGDLLEPFLK